MSGWYKLKQAYLFDVLQLERGQILLIYIYAYTDWFKTEAL